MDGQGRSRPLQAEEFLCGDTLEAASRGLCSRQHRPFGSELLALNLWVESMEVLYLPHESIHLVQYVFY